MFRPDVLQDAYELPAVVAPARRLPVWWDHALLVGLVLLTRVPLWGSFAGEPDTARYVFGLRFWMEHGPEAPGIINRELSSGYYWLAAHLAALTGLDFADFPELLGAISLVAALLTAPALYYLGTRVVSRTAALMATIVLLLGPGWWWTGLQAHPQGLTLVLQLASMIAFMEAWRRTPARPSAVWLVASVVALTASLLVKSDAALLFPAYFGLRFFQRSTQQPPARVDRLGWSVLVTAGVLAAAYGAFTVLHRLITGPVPAVADQATAHINRFLSIPRGSALLAQLAPMLFGPGPVIFLVAIGAAAVFFVRGQTPARMRWAILLATWSVPGYLFWLCIAGNNARHVLPFPIPIVWLALAWLERGGVGRMVTIAAVAMLGNLVVPANSGVSLYPSANVPQSAALMRERQDELRQVATRLLAGRADSACYVGRTTQDYVTHYLLEQADAAGYRVDVLPSGQLALLLSYPDGRLFRQIDMIGLRDRQDAGINPRLWPGCATVESLEYDPAGRRLRFFGTEPRLVDQLVNLVR
jgi:hypothetical protein